MNRWNNKNKLKKGTTAFEQIKKKLTNPKKKRECKRIVYVCDVFIFLCIYYYVRSNSCRNWVWITNIADFKYKDKIFVEPRGFL